MSNPSGISIRPGDSAPAWVLPLLHGDELALGSLRGKQVLLFFWGSW